MPPPPDRAQNPLEGWAVEPELKDMPPRRIVPVNDYPDLNKPNGTLFMGLGGGLLVIGLVLFVVGLASHKALFTILGLVLALAGTGLLVWFPTKLRAHLARAEHLVTNGTPFPARVVSAENMTGDSTYNRSVKYQVTIPGGEMIHRDVNVDERLLPRRIPGDATVLVDMSTGDAELYCALPFRAVPKTGPVAVSTVHAAPSAAPFPSTPAVTPDLPVATPTPTATPGAMGTIGTPIPTPVRPTLPAEPTAPAPTTAEPEPAPSGEQKQQQSQQTTSGLPWE